MLVVRLRLTRWRSIDHQHLGPRIPKLQRNITDNGIVKSSSWYSLNVEYSGSIKTRWFRAISWRSEKSNRYLWTSLAPNLVPAKTTCAPSFHSKPTNFLWRTERRKNWTATTRTYSNIRSTRWSAPETQHISYQVFPKYSLMRSRDSNDLGRGKKRDNGTIVIDQWNRSIGNDKNVMNLQSLWHRRYFEVKRNWTLSKTYLEVKILTSDKKSQIWVFAVLLYSTMGARRESKDPI